MEFNLSTPALLFSAISLLLLAYSNRFLAIAQLLRDLFAKYRTNPSESLKAQLTNLEKRISIIKNMQLLGVISFFFCVFSMFLIFASQVLWGEIVFGTALLFLMASLALSIWEIFISVQALTIQLDECRNPSDPDCKPGA